MARSLLGEIAHQIFYTPKKHKKEYYKKPSKPNRDYVYEKMEYDRKKALFENQKMIDIIKLQGKSKGWF